VSITVLTVTLNTCLYLFVVRYPVLSAMKGKHRSHEKTAETAPESLGVLISQVPTESGKRRMA
jgi:hypothetical protein